MSDPASFAPPGRGLRIVAVLALLWNLFGVASYLMSVTTGPEAVQALPEAERVLYQDIPAWVTASFAVAVFAGLAGSGLLLARRALALPLFALSLAAVGLQTGHAFLMTPMLEIQDPPAAVLPGLIIVTALALLAFARRAQRRGWLA
jgi:hypothetical protein